jgi:hypothetical protein
LPAALLVPASLLLPWLLELESPPQALSTIVNSIATASRRAMLLFFIRIASLNDDGYMVNVIRPSVRRGPISNSLGSYWNRNGPIPQLRRKAAIMKVFRQNYKQTMHTL